MGRASPFLKEIRIEGEAVGQGRGREVWVPQPQGKSLKGPFASLTCHPFTLGQSFPTLR